MLSQIRPIIYKMLSTQAAAVVFIAAFVYFYKDLTAMYSVLLGGGVNLLANIYFAKRVFTYTGAQAAGKIVKSFYQAELVKILLTGTLFLVALKWQLAQPLAFFLGYVVAQLGFWVAAIISGRRFCKAEVA